MLKVPILKTFDRGLHGAVWSRLIKTRDYAFFSCSRALSLNLISYCNLEPMPAAVTPAIFYPGKMLPAVERGHSADELPSNSLSLSAFHH